MVPYDKKGAFAPGTPVVAGHKSAVLDFDFNPFHEHIIASASEDSTIKARPSEPAKRTRRAPAARDVGRPWRRSGGSRRTG